MSRWKQGDTQPHMVIDCFDANGARPRLDLASSLKLMVWNQGELVIDRAVTGTSNGVVDLQLQESDVAVPGTFKAKVFAQWPDGTKQHYPPADQYMTYTITK